MPHINIHRHHPNDRRGQTGSNRNPHHHRNGSGQEPGRRPRDNQISDNQQHPHRGTGHHHDCGNRGIKSRIDQGHIGVLRHHEIPVKGHRHLFPPRHQQYHERGSAQHRGLNKPGIRHIQEPAKHERIQLAGIVPNGQAQHHANPIKTGEHHGSTGLGGSPPGDKRERRRGNRRHHGGAGHDTINPTQGQAHHHAGKHGVHQSLHTEFHGTQVNEHPHAAAHDSENQQQHEGALQVREGENINEHDATELHWCRRWRHDHRQKPRFARIVVRQDCSRGWTPPPRFPAA